MAPVLGIVLLGHSLLKVMPEDFKRQALGVLIDKGEQAFILHICESGVYKRTGLPREICHKVAHVIANEFRKEVGIKRR